MQFPQVLCSALGWLAFHFAELQPFIPTYLHLIVSAVFPIYAGAHSSLSRPSSAAKPKKSAGKDENHSPEEDDETHRMESLSPSDAILFPVLAGATLAIFYFLIKWLDDAELLNKILNVYFATFSIFAVARLISDGLDVIHSLLFPRSFVDRGILFHVRAAQRCVIPVSSRMDERRTNPLPGPLSRLPLPGAFVNALWFFHSLPAQKLTLEAYVHRILDLKIRLGIHGIGGLCTGLAVVFTYNFIHKSWPLTNIMGFGIAYGALQLMSPATFLTGTLILVGLFCYDIYFVFYTPMMVTVAKSLDVPIKLLFPRPSEPGQDPATKALSMLGLGDIVLPGMVIGLALRFDLFLFYLRKQTWTEEPGLTEVTNASLISPSEGLNAAVADGVTEAAKAEPKKSSSSSRVARKVKAPYKSVAHGWGDRFWTLTGNPAFDPAGRFPKRYFCASLNGYLAGMIVTLFAMQISNHPQPALLYLVPCVLISLWTTAWFRGELKEMMKFDDSREDSDGKQSPQKASSDEGDRDTKREQQKTQTEARDESRVESKDRPSGDEKQDRRNTLVLFSIAAPESKSTKCRGMKHEGNDESPQWRSRSNQIKRLRVS